MRKEIRSYEDIVWFENQIKTMLKCEGQNCSFLQSSEYKKLHMTLLLKLNHVISFDAPMHICMGGGLSLRMHACASVVEIITTNHKDHEETKTQGMMVQGVNRQRKRKREGEDRMDNFQEKIQNNRAFVPVQLPQ